MTPAPDLSPRRYRLKEALPASLRLSPLRLLGGFVCADTHLGCQGCTFCLNRRYPPLGEVLDRGIHRDFAEIGCPPEELARHIRALPLFARARAPLRLGHLTDASFESAGLCALLASLPLDAPVILLTRRPLDPALVPVIAARPNLLVHVTLTPDRDAPASLLPVLESLREVPGRQRFIRFSPLMAGMEGPVREVLAELPRGTAVGLGELKTNGIDAAATLTPMAPAGIRALEEAAWANGVEFYDYFGCRLRRLMGVPFSLRLLARRTSPRTCERCPNTRVCASAPRPGDLGDAELIAEARLLGLNPRRVTRTETTLTLEVEEDCGRADEVHLSERFAQDIHFSSIARAAERGVVALSEAVIARWERVGFYPAARMREVSREMAERCRLSA